jgi:hypothetical protein
MVCTSERSPAVANKSPFGLFDHDIAARYLAQSKEPKLREETEIRFRTGLNYAERVQFCEQAHKPIFFV